MFYLAAIVGAVVSFVFGCIWYTAFFGKQWQASMGFSDEKIKTIFTPKKMICAFIAEWFYSACVTGILFNMPLPLWTSGLMLGCIIVASGVKLSIFDGKSLRTILINEGYRLISVIIMVVSVTIFL